MGTQRLWDGYGGRARATGNRRRWLIGHQLACSWTHAGEAHYRDILEKEVERAGEVRGPRHEGRFPEVHETLYFSPAHVPPEDWWLNP
jgi:hypothetical protein